MKNLLENETRCLIVQPKFSDFSFWKYKDVCELVGAKHLASPLSLMTVAALLPQQWEYKLIDENVEISKEEYFEWADIVCMGGMISQKYSLLSLIDRAHQHGCPVVVGGADPTFQPHLYQSADYLILGEGEVTIPMFLEDLRKGCTSGEYKSDDKADMGKSVVPRFDLIRFQNYIQIGIQFSRGCPFNCEYCGVIELFGRRPRTKTPEQIIRELQALYELGHRGNVDFVDDNFIGNKKKVKEVLLAIKEWSETNNYPFYFSTETSLNLVKDEDLLQKMQDVDFRFIFIGIETPEDEVLKTINKSSNINIPIQEAINKIYSYGIIITAGFMIGFDNETDQIAEKMINCIQNSGICIAMLGKLLAVPNTQLTRRLKREERLINDDTKFDKNKIEVDQMTGGLNFITTRPRINILRDYMYILQYIYQPKYYYERVIYTGLHLQPIYKQKLTFSMKLKMLPAFFKLSLKAGFNQKTGWLYWKTFFIVIFRNPKAIEATLNLTAIFLHLYKVSKYMVELTKKEINILQKNVKGD